MEGTPVKECFRRIRTLVVDDTAFMRRALVEILSQDEEIEVVGVAKHGVEAIEAIGLLEPDVVTLDVDMPVMDGLTAIKHIMIRSPRPVIIISGLANQGSITLEALRLGAVDFFPKPSGTISLDIHQQAKELSEVVKQAARISPSAIRRVRLSHREAFAHARRHADSPLGLVIIVAPTGASGHLIRLLANTRADLPIAIVAIQNISAQVLESYSVQLDSKVSWSLVSGEDRMLTPGTFILATFKDICALERSSEALRVKDEPPNGDIDRLMAQAADIMGPLCLAAAIGETSDQVMKGLTKIKKAGGTSLRMEQGAYARGAPSSSLQSASAYEPVASEHELWSRIETFGRGILLNAAADYTNIKR
jgi:two-component system chemotaxis response regulator CheB